jgi:hypothetical protein
LLTDIWEFWLPITSHMVRHSSVRKLDPENMKVAAEILFLSFIRAEIYPFRFRGRHIGILPHSYMPHGLPYLRWEARPRKCTGSRWNSASVLIEAEIQVLPVWRPPYWNYDFRLHQTMFAIALFRNWTAKMDSWHLDLICYV